MMLALVVIGVAIVTRRMVALYGPARPDSAGLDTGFAQYRALTTLHILPALVFVLLGPLQFVRRLRTRFPRLHRWVGRVFLIAGLIVGITALIMGPAMAVGGALEATATTIFGAYFLFALGKAFFAIRRRKVATHRVWMIRAFATGLAVATIRPIIGFFFATRRLTGLTPHEFFGIAFWLGFTFQTAAAELWIRRNTLPSYAGAMVRKS